MNSGDVFVNMIFVFYRFWIAVSGFRGECDSNTPFDLLEMYSTKEPID